MEPTGRMPIHACLLFRTFMYDFLMILADVMLLKDLDSKCPGSGSATLILRADIRSASVTRKCTNPGPSMES